MTTVISKLPSEIHSSAHQVRYDHSLVGEYEIRIYRGVSGPVVVLEATSASPLPLEYLSERAVIRFLETLPSSRSRFFERHVTSGREDWVEVGFTQDGFARGACPAETVTAAVVGIMAASAGDTPNDARIAATFSARRQ